MCCNDHSRSLTAVSDECTHSSETLVATPLPDGYWIHTFPFTTTDTVLPDLVGYGLGFEGKLSTIKLFQNPKNAASKGWKLTEIQSMDFPVAMTYADLTGDGFNDIIICDRYGPSMDDLWDAQTDNGGRVQWLRNPGDRNTTSYWKPHPIGNSTGMHRLQAGHFTTADYWQIMALPIIAASSDLDSPAPVIIYTPVYGSDKSEGPKTWTQDIHFPSQFRLIHDVKLLKGMNDGLDMVLVAGREGIVLLWFDVSKKTWQYNVVGTGSPQTGNNPYWGSGSVDLARVGDDEAGYVATCEGFHGNIVSVYVKDNNNAPKGASSLKDSRLWKRVVIADFGDLNDKFTGTIHHVAVSKNSSSRMESFAVACMGAPPEKPENQGVYLYTPIDLAKERFTTTKLTDESAGRLAVGGFTGIDAEEIASISYYVPGYHVGRDPSSIRINTLQPFNIELYTTITAKKLDKEVILYLPRPSIVPQGYTPTMSMVTIANKKLTVVVLRPGATIQLEPRDGVKVIYGSIEVTIDGKQTTRSVAPAAKEADTILTSGTAQALENGAIILRIEPLTEFQGPYSSMDQVQAENVFPYGPQVPLEVNAMAFPFHRVDTLEWGKSGLWDGYEFYNMTGFHVFFNDDAAERIVHIQAWTLGIGETARFHVHNTLSFCEIHCCLTNGGGDAGMRYFEYGPEHISEKEIQQNELDKDYVEKNSTLLVVPDMAEHGPLWRIQDGYQARPKLLSNDTVDYPWHAWLASEFGDHNIPIDPPLNSSEQKYDLWLAFEFPTTLFQF